MLVGVYQSAGLLMIIAAFYITDFFLIARYDRERTAEGSGRSWDYTLFLLVVAILLLTQPILLPQISVRLKGWPGGVIQAAGLITALGGLGVHWWARAYLKQYYAERVEVQPEHAVISSGPYAYVRHPVITSFFMIVIGIFLINPSLLSLLLIGYTFWDFSRAARQEEQLLSRTLPAYAAYQARVPAFFPVLKNPRRGK